jgi:hypothetical protein
VLHKHAKIETRTAGLYQQLVRRFTTGARTIQVRFILDTVIHSPYQEGHVTYDDCTLTQSFP